MPRHYSCNDPDTWKISPPFAEWMLVISEAVGRMATFAMADDPEEPESMDTPIVCLLYMAPNQTLQRHSHACHRIEVVILGSLNVGDRWLHPGDVWSSKPDENYGPHTAGPTGSMTVEIFSKGSGFEPLVDPSSLTADDLAQFETLKELLGAWRAEHGRYPGGTPEWLLPDLSIQD